MKNQRLDDGEAKVRAIRDSLKRMRGKLTLVALAVGAYLVGLEFE